MAGWMKVGGWGDLRLRRTINRHNCDRSREREKMVNTLKPKAIKATGVIKVREEQEVNRMKGDILNRSGCV